VTNLLEHNREAWNEEVKKGNQWTLPASKEDIKKAKNGHFEIVLTPLSRRKISYAWLPAVASRARSWQQPAQR